MDLLRCWSLSISLFPHFDTLCKGPTLNLCSTTLWARHAGCFGFCNLAYQSIYANKIYEGKFFRIILYSNSQYMLKLHSSWKYLHDIVKLNFNALENDKYFAGTVKEGKNYNNLLWTNWTFYKLLCERCSYDKRASYSEDLVVRWIPGFSHKSCKNTK